jgi:hypothetical protein
MTLEEKAAMIDGDSPLRVLWSVIIPQSYPALMAITVDYSGWCIAGAHGSPSPVRGCATLLRPGYRQHEC